MATDNANNTLHERIRPLKRSCHRSYNKPSIELCDNCPLPITVPVQRRIYAYKFRQRKPRIRKIVMPDASSAAEQADVDQHVAAEEEPLDSLIVDEDMDVTDKNRVEKLQRVHAQLEINRPYLIDQFVAYGAQATAARQAEQQATISMYHGLLDQARARHAAHDPVGAAVASRQGTSVVRLQHFTWHTDLHVPHITCSECGLKDEPVAALEVGCFYSGYGQEGTDKACWMPESLLCFFSHLHQMGGVGGAGSNRVACCIVGCGHSSTAIPMLLR